MDYKKYILLPSLRKLSQNVFMRRSSYNLLLPPISCKQLEELKVSMLEKENIQLRVIFTWKCRSITLGSSKTRLYKVSQIYDYTVNNVWQIKCKVYFIKSHYCRIQFLIKLDATSIIISVSTIFFASFYQEKLKIKNNGKQNLKKKTNSISKLPEFSIVGFTWNWKLGIIGKFSFTLIFGSIRNSKTRKMTSNKKM